MGCRGQEATTREVPDTGAAVERTLGALGFQQFKPGQREVVESVLAGRDTLAILPTGGGKSLCYQLPSLLLPGVTLVVSPLIALIRDQVARAQARGLSATALSSMDGREQKEARLGVIARGEVNLVYAAPEGLRSTAVITALAQAGVSLMCVDEAHCISAWGHDFRPDYARLGALREVLKPRSVLAVTATATPQVQQDIQRSLGMRRPAVVITGLDRPNLRLEVQEVRGSAAKLRAIRDAVLNDLAGGGSAILYCATRRAAEGLTVQLRERGISAVAYHAGLPALARDAAQDAWEQGAVPIICATTAFGMGVDKPDVRLVAHHSLPRSPEAYYQEVGRAGRDGQPARGLLFYDPSDARLLWQLVDRSCATACSVRQVYAYAWGNQDADGVCAPTMEALMARVDPGGGPAARAAVVYLVQSGALAEAPEGVRLAGGPPGQLWVDEARLAARLASERQKLSNMVAYVQRATCRRAFLLQHFTGSPSGPCGSCDLCALGVHVRPDDDLRTDVLKALSCVARMMGRYGRGKVVDVLMGSHARPVVQAGLHTLSTHGLLKHKGRAAVQELLLALERSSLVVSTSGPYPTLDLTDAGAAVLQGGVLPPLWIRPTDGEVDALDGAEEPMAALAVVPSVPEPGEDRVPSVELDGVAEPLLSTLRCWRGQTARQMRVPPYVLLTDRTLRALVALKPRTAEELRRIPGMGEAKVSRYGAAILEVVRGG